MLKLIFKEDTDRLQDDYKLNIKILNEQNNKLQAENKKLLKQYNLEVDDKKSSYERYLVKKIHEI